MLKKTVKYTDYNGDDREEVLYFSLNRAELLRMNMVKHGGFSKYMEKLIEERDPEKLTQMFEMFILNSYGIKSEDGTRFVKNPQVLADFQNSAAYAQIFYELATDLNEFANFILGIVPDDIAKEFVESDDYKKVISQISNTPGDQIPPGQMTIS